MIRTIERQTSNLDDRRNDYRGIGWKEHSRYNRLELDSVTSICLAHLKKDHMELVVYSAAWCPDCREAKRFLQKNGIPYEEVDIEATPGAAEELVRRTGRRSLPQFVIDGKWIQPYRPGEGFLYEEMSKRLGIPGS
jgi:glutaredoxin